MVAAWAGPATSVAASATAAATPVASSADSFLRLGFPVCMGDLSLGGRETAVARRPDGRLPGTDLHPNRPLQDGT